MILSSKKGYFLAGIVVVLGYFYFIPVLNFSNRVLSTCFYPFLFVQNKLALISHDVFTSKRDLGNKYSQLQVSFEEILQENIYLKSLNDFAIQTSEMVEYQKRYSSTKAILSQVILRNFDSGLHYYLVDRGSHSGISEDMVAIYKNNIIGRVVKVYPFYSKVVLISDHTCKISVYCDETKTAGIFQGRNNLSHASLNHVSHLQDVHLDELIFSSGDGLIYPRGFAVGKITGVEKTDINQIVDIEFLVDLSSINFVYLILKSDY